MVPAPIPPPVHDADLPRYLADLGLPGIVDLHVHFMPDRVQQKVWAFFDALGERGEPAWPITYRWDENSRMAHLRQMGVRAFSTLNYAHRPQMAAWLNDYSAALADRHEDIIRSGTFFPEDGMTAEVERRLAEGVRVFKIHIQIGDFSPTDPRLKGVWSALSGSGVPVVIHCGDGPRRGRHTGPGPVRALVERYPDLVLVIAHAGLPGYRDFAELARSAPHVHLDTTMVGTSFMERTAPVPEDYPETMAELADKVVLGTDFPSIPYPYAHQIAVLHEWGLGADWMRRVLWHNPRRLLGLDSDAVEEVEGIS